MFKKENIEWYNYFGNILAVSYTLWPRETWCAAVHEVTTERLNWTDDPITWASPVTQMVKNPTVTQETWLGSLGGEHSPGEGNGNPLQDSCLENPHGQRSLAGYILWFHKKSDMTEWLTTWSNHSTSRYLPWEIKKHIHRKACMQIFIAFLCVTAKSNSNIHQQVKDKPAVLYPHIGILLNSNKNELQIQVLTWMHFKIIILSEKKTVKTNEPTKWYHLHKIL